MLILTLDFGGKGGEGYAMGVSMGEVSDDR